MCDCVYAIGNTDGSVEILTTEEKFATSHSYICLEVSPLLTLTTVQYCYLSHCKGQPLWSSTVSHSSMDWRAD